MTVAAVSATRKPIFARPLVDPDWLVAAMAALAMLVLAMFGPGFLSDGDTTWHLAAGDWMIRHGQAPRTDPFSFTFAGAPWQAHEWLSEVVMTIAFRLGGWTGLVILFGLVLASAALLLVAQLGKSLTGVGLLLAVVLTLACAAPSLLARPHVMMLPLLIGWTSILLSARASGRAPPLWAGGLMLLWANIHGSFVFGLLLLAVLGLEALVEAKPEQRWIAVRDWGAFAALSVLAAAVTPQGISGLLFPFQLMSMSSLADVAEWRASDFSKVGAFEISLLVVLFACLSRGVKVPLLRLFLLLLLLHMSLQHARHVIVVAMVAALVLAPCVAEAAGRAGTVRRMDAQPLAWLAVAAAVLALIGARAAVALDLGDEANMPAMALAHVPASLRARPVFNEYGFGGYLIFKGVRPFIDGRTDLYGDAFMARYKKIVSPDHEALDAAIRQYQIAWTILPPDNPVVAELDHEPGWRRLYADKYAVIHVRQADAAGIR
jgi:hypothetical protein